MSGWFKAHRGRQKQSAMGRILGATLPIRMQPEQASRGVDASRIGRAAPTMIKVRIALRPEDRLKGRDPALQSPEFGRAQIGQRRGRKFQRQVKDTLVTGWHGSSDLLV